MITPITLIIDNSFTMPRGLEIILNDETKLEKHGKNKSRIHGKAWISSFIHNPDVNQKFGCGTIS